MFDRIRMLGGVIDFKTQLVIFTIERRKIPIVFNIAPIHKGQLIIGNKWLEEFNPDLD